MENIYIFLVNNSFLFNGIIFGDCVEKILTNNFSEEINISFPDVKSIDRFITKLSQLFGIELYFDEDKKIYKYILHNNVMINCFVKSFGKDILLRRDFDKKFLPESNTLIDFLKPCE